MGARRLDSDLTQERAQTEKLRAEVAALTEASASSAAEADAQLNALRRELGSAREEAAGAAEKADADVSSLTTQLAMMQRSLITGRKRVNELEAAIEGLKTNVEAVQTAAAAEVAEMREQCDAAVKTAAEDRRALDSALIEASECRVRACPPPLA